MPDDVANAFHRRKKSHLLDLAKFPLALPLKKLIQKYPVLGTVLLEERVANDQSWLFGWLVGGWVVWLRELVFVYFLFPWTRYSMNSEQASFT